MQGTTYAYDVPFGQCAASTVPGAPAGGVAFFIYEINEGSLNTANNLGVLAITCTEVFQGLDVATALTINGVDIIRANAIGNYSSNGSFPVLTGFLGSPDASTQIRFGELGSNAGLTPFDPFVDADFTVGVDTFARLVRSRLPDLGQETIFINIFRGLNAFEFDFTANLMGATSSLSGGAIFSTAQTMTPQFIACFDGSYENLNVLEADPSCAGPGFGDPVPLPQSDRDAIRSAYDALRQMHDVVTTIAEVSAAAGVAAIEAQVPQ